MAETAAAAALLGGLPPGDEGSGRGGGGGGVSDGGSRSLPLSRTVSLEEQRSMIEAREAAEAGAGLVKVCVCVCFWLSAQGTRGQRLVFDGCVQIVLRFADALAKFKVYEYC